MRNSQNIHQAIPYQLAMDIATNRLCARGPIDLIQKVLTVPGAAWHNDQLPYVSLPNERCNYLVLESIETPESVSDNYRNSRCSVMSITSAQEQYIDKLLNKIRLNDDAPSVMLHQKEYIFKCIQVQPPIKGILNGSEQGTGKTFEHLVIAYILGKRRVLTICPADLIPQWKQEHDMWFSQYNYQGVPDRFQFWLMTDVDIDTRGKAFRILRREPGRHMCVINFEVIRRLKEEIRAFEPDLLIIDESHYVKNPKAQVTKVIDELCQEIPTVLLGGGTPIGNDVGDYYSQIKMIAPHLVHTRYEDFMERFAKYEVQHGKGGQVLRTKWNNPIKKAIGCLDPAGLMRLLDPIWFRATKAICLDLPPKIYHPDVILDLDPDVRSLYKRVVESGEQALGNDLSLVGQLVIIMRLQQITGGHVVQFTQSEDGIVVSQVVDQLPSVKLRWLESFTNLRLLPYPTVRCIVWCRFNAEVDTCYKSLCEILGHDRVAFVNGSVKSTEVPIIKESFNSRSPYGIQVIVAQYDKMYKGHNLQAADFHVRFSHTWSYIKKIQAEDRSDRMGRVESVEDGGQELLDGLEGHVSSQYINLIARGTVDEEIIKAQARKRDLSVRLAPDTVSGVLNEDDLPFSEELLETNNAYIC